MHFIFREKNGGFALSEINSPGALRAKILNSKSERFVHRSVRMTKSDQEQSPLNIKDYLFLTQSKCLFTSLLKPVALLKTTYILWELNRGIPFSAQSPAYHCKKEASIILVGARFTHVVLKLMKTLQVTKSPRRIWEASNRW